jgi:hypothetical protein
VPKKVADTRDAAEQIAAQVNAQLAIQAPTLLSFQPISVTELRRQFLDHHEHVLKSTMATVRRYRAATHHLERFAELQPHQAVHQIKPDRFAVHLRSIEIAPNGHSNTSRRRLRDKGVHFVLKTCRAMYAYAGQRAICRCTRGIRSPNFHSIGSGSKTASPSSCSNRTRNWRFYKRATTGLSQSTSR